MPLGAEEQLILSLLRSETVTAGTPKNVDWGRVMDLAREQAVLPQLARRIQTDEGTPPSVRREARDEARRLAELNLHSTAALLEATEALEGRSIPVLSFKGPTLAQVAYGDPGARAFDDLDILVRASVVEPARNVLIQLGYRPSFVFTPAARRLLLQRGSHETFEREDGVAIEIHWRIAGAVSDFGLDHDRLWARSMTLDLGRRGVQVLSPEDLLLVLVVHGTKHAWERLGWIYDVAAFVRSNPHLDWDQISRESAAMGSIRPLRLALHLADELFGAPVPSSLVHAARGDRAVLRLATTVRRDLFRPSRSGAGTFGFHLLTRERLADKARLVVGSLTALNQLDLQARLPLASLYFLRRPARLLGKALTHALGRTPRDNA